MSEIRKNYFIAVSTGGKVRRLLYANSITAVPLLKDRYHTDDVDVYNISSYGFKFADTRKDAPVGSRCRVRRINDGKEWPCVRDCCMDLGVTGKMLIRAITQKRLLYGCQYVFVENVE